MKENINLQTLLLDADSDSIGEQRNCVILMLNGKWFPIFWLEAVKPTVAAEAARLDFSYW